MTHRSGIFKLVLSASLVLSLASCHKNYYNDDLYGYGRRHRTQPTEQPSETGSETKKKPTGSKYSIPEEWRTLDLELGRRDNKELYREIKSWLGTPYGYGRMEKGVACDCSGFVNQVYKKVYQIALERNSARIFTQNCREISRDDLREGDLVFFNGGTRGRITHVGIYLKDGYFAHASSSRGVMVSSLEQRYYITHWQCAGRAR